MRAAAARTAVVRAETPADTAAIRAIQAAAFGRTGEADLVDALRAASKIVVSLVAAAEGEIVGSVVFSPVEIEGLPAPDQAVGLAPLAVAAAHRRHGIGARLVEAGLAACRRNGYCAAVVLGDPAYYRRFGFVSARQFGLKCEYDVPDDAFMAIELRPGTLRGATGLCRYAPEFRDL